MENKILNLLKKIIKEDEDTFIDITDMDDDSAAKKIMSKKDIFKKLRDKMSDKDRTPGGYEYGEIVSGQMGEELTGGQSKIDVAEPKGKITAADFKKLRDGKKSNKSEVEENIFKNMFGKKEDPEVAREKDRKENPYLGNLGYDYDDIRGWHYVGPGQGRFDNRDSEDMEIEEGMYGSFGDPKRKDFKGDEYYDEKDRPVRSGDIYGIGGDDFDTEEFDTFQQLYDKYGDKQSWFNKRDGETMFNKYREMTGKPFKVKTRKNEIGEAMYGSFGDPKRKDFKGDEYYDEKDRPVRSGDIYGIGGDDFDTEEFDTFQQLYDKYGDKQSWFNKRDGETMFNKYREMTGKPFKVKTRKMDGEMGEDYEDSRYSEDYDEDYDSKKVKGYSNNGAIFDSIFGESKVDKVISKYFEVSKKEIREGKEKQIQEIAKKKAVVNQIMESVVKMTETIEQELTAKKFLKENINSKFIGITNKKNLVFETKTGQVRITPNGDLI